MKIINVQENKIFAGEEDFLKFVSVTGVTPHASIAGVYNGIAKIAEEKGSKIFTTSKSSEKEKIQEAIDKRLKEERQEILFESWDDFKEEFSEEKQEALKNWDKFFDGDFYFVELNGLACDSYSKYGKIQNTNSLVIFKIEKQENTERIELQHKEIFCIDRQFGNETPKRKNGKYQKVDRAENIKKGILDALQNTDFFTDALFYAYKIKNVEFVAEIKENIFLNISKDIDIITIQQVEEEEKILEERKKEIRKRIEEEKNRATQKEKQKEAQKKAKEAAQIAEKREKAIEIYKGFFEKDPTEDEIKKIMEKM